MKFNCCFEQDSKGIYFKVEDNTNHISIGMYNDFNLQTEVCIRKEDVEKLIEFLQNSSIMKLEW